MIHFPPVIGHRGAAGIAPENTLASFQAAADVGARMVEFDVRLTADAKPVVFHDDGLERTTDGRGPVAGQTLAALARLDAGAWFAPRFAGQPIPTLGDALAQCERLGLAINMEIKPDRGRAIETAEIALADALALWPPRAPPPLVSSFQPDCLEVAARLAPSWPRGLLVDELALDRRALARRLGCFSVHADHRGLDQPAVAAFRNSGLSVLAYTVNDKARQDVLLSMGVASVFSDFPGL